MKNNGILIGIDAGVNTGLARIQNGQLVDVRTFSIIEAMEYVKTMSDYCKKYHHSLKICIEDARQRKWFGSKGREVLQGVGSVKRDCSIWEEFCLYHNIDFELIAPKHNRTKTTAQEFGRITGWKNRTSQHGRDAAMLIFWRTT